MAEVDVSTTRTRHGAEVLRARRRTMGLPLVVAASLALVACAPGTLDADPAASDAPDSASPSATPEPSPAGERFDDVDLAAALVPVPHDPGDPEPWGAWGAAPLEEIVPALDPAAFEAAPECAAAVAAADAVVPEEVVAGGYPYEGVLVTWIVVGRMGSPEDASAYVDALAAAATACEDVQGVAQMPGGVTAVRGPLEVSEAVVDAGMQELAVGYDGSFHYDQYVLVAHDELVVATPYRADVVGGDAESVGIVQTQVDALGAAVGG